jgi:cellulose synthase/poly-beta-1,6-N-acetylglucosamine synthase-like glycosyltransferase
MLTEFLIAVNVISLVVLITYATRQYIFVFAALRHTEFTDPSNYQPNYTVTILIPARNEEKVIGRTLEFMSRLDYSTDKLEIVVLNDASTDNTSKIAHEWADKYAWIRVIDRPLGGLGKGDVLNQGIKETRNEIIFIFDADYTPAPDTIKRLIRWFDDPKVGLVQGKIQVDNKDENNLTKMVHTERCAGFLCDLLARDKLKVTNQYGGTAGGFRRTLISKVGEWAPRTFCEDTDLTCRTLLAGFKVKYDVSVSCGEEAPNRLKVYYKQRYRWIRGHVVCGLMYTAKFMVSPFLSLREKVDGVLWLNLNCIPMFITVGTIVGLMGLFFLPVNLIPEPFSVALMVFGTGATFATVSIGLYRVKQIKYLKFAFLMMLNSYVMCFVICLKVYFDILANRSFKWEKTERSGIRGIQHGK